MTRVRLAVALLVFPAFALGLAGSLALAQPTRPSVARPVARLEGAARQRLNLPTPEGTWGAWIAPPGSPWRCQAMGHSTSIAVHVRCRAGRGPSFELTVSDCRNEHIIRLNESGEGGGRWSLVLGCAPQRLPGFE